MSNDIGLNRLQRSAHRLLRLGLSVCAIFLALLPVVAEAQTLQRVLDRGFLVCGTADPVSGFSQRSDAGVWVGFDVDICRALAAAVLGDADKVEFRAMSGEARFAQLQTGEVDVMVRDGSWTMRRDTAYGVTFAATTFFDGLSFLVPAETGFVSAYVLENVSVCVSEQGDDRAKVREFSFENQSNLQEVVYESRADLVFAYRAGYCDVVAAPLSVLQSFRRGLAAPGQHRIMPELLTKAPTGPVVASGDDDWANIVRWVVYGLLNAEELGITSVNVESLQNSRTPAIRRVLGIEGDFGTPIGLDAQWAARIISSVGNYREIFDRHFGPQTGAGIQRGQNSLWSQGGMFYAPPIR